MEPSCSVLSSLGVSSPASAPSCAVLSDDCFSCFLSPDGSSCLSLEEPSFLPPCLPLPLGVSSPAIASSGSVFSALAVCPLHGVPLGSCLLTHLPSLQTARLQGS